MDQNQPISPCNGDAISASVRIMARSLQHRRVAWMHDFRDSPTRRSSHSTNPEVERRRSRRDTAPPNFRVFKVNQPVLALFIWRRRSEKKEAFFLDLENLEIEGRTVSSCEFELNKLALAAVTLDSLTPVTRGCENFSVSMRDSSDGKRE